MNQWNQWMLCLAFDNNKHLLMVDKRTSTFRSTEGDVVQRQSMI